MAKAAALAEAKAWLRGLSSEEALKRAAQLRQGVERGKRRELPPLDESRPATSGKGDRPYAHPYYWAAFVLIGDPDERHGPPRPLPGFVPPVKSGRSDRRESCRPRLLALRYGRRSTSRNPPGPRPYLP